MAHEVENMFSVKELPWHGLGSVITKAPTIAEGLKLAGLDWKVNVEVPICPSDGLPMTGWSQTFRRSDTGAIIGSVGPKTYPLQNDRAFDFFEPFLADGQAKLETAGCLKQGQRVWVMARLNLDNDVIVKGDEIRKYVLLSNSHDGITAVRVGFTPVRVVCANTLAAAHGSKASSLIRLRHSKDVDKNLENVRNTMNLLEQEFQATAEQYRLLANRNVNQKDLEKYVRRVFKMPTDETLATRTQNNLNTIIEYVEAGEGQNVPGISGTWWWAYNGVNGFLNHKHGRTNDNRLDSLWFGQNAKVNDTAKEIALEMAA